MEGSRVKVHGKIIGHILYADKEGREVSTWGCNCGIFTSDTFYTSDNAVKSLIKHRQRDECIMIPDDPDASDNPDES